MSTRQQTNIEFCRSVFFKYHFPLIFVHQLQVSFPFQSYTVSIPAKSVVLQKPQDMVYVTVYKVSQKTAICIDFVNTVYFKIIIRKRFVRK